MIDLELNIFLDKLFTNLKAFKIDLSEYVLDHIAYSTATAKEYDQLKPEFLQLGQEIRESLVGNRRVSVVKLNKSLKYKHYSIDAIELIEPKPGTTGKSGLEHAEFVVGDLEQIPNQFPQIPWDTSAISRAEYPKVQFKFDDGIGIKFHPQHILVEAASYS